MSSSTASASSPSLELTLGNDISPGTEPRQRPDDRPVGIRLHGVADERRNVGEGARKHPVMALQRRVE
jgi:hypothetical protein